MAPNGKPIFPKVFVGIKSVKQTSPRVSTCCYCRSREPLLDTGFERIVPVLLAVAAAGLGWGAVRLKRRLGQSERERRRATDELNRRLSELLSVRELFHVLSGSLHVDRIAEQVARYAMRFLNAQGALVALAADGGSGGRGGGGEVDGGHGGGRGSGAAREGGRGPLHVAAAVRG